MRSLSGIRIFLLAAAVCASLLSVHALVIDLNDPNAFYYRFDSPAAATLSWTTTLFPDIDGNGRPDMVIPAFRSAFNGASSGSTYIIYDSILNSTSLGNVFNLSNTSAYNLRIDGSVAGARLGLDYAFADFDGDGRTDMVVAPSNIATADFGIYIIPHEMLNVTGTGNSFNVSNTSTWRYRIFAGTKASAVETGDFNNDGFPDLYIADSSVQLNGANSGAAYILNNSFVSGTATGTEINLSNTSLFSVRIDGNPNSSFQTLALGVNLNKGVGDFTGNGLDDLILTSSWFFRDGNTGVGGTWILRNEMLPKTGTGNILNLSNASHFTTLFYGTSTNVFSYVLPYDDLDGDGIEDFLFGSGSQFALVYDSVFATLVSSNGTIVPMNGTLMNTSTFSGFGTFNGVLNDYTNDGNLDFLINDVSADYSGTDEGSTFLVNSSLFNNLSGDLAINETGNFIVRWDGDDLSKNMYVWQAGDFNGDGFVDNVISTTDSTHGGALSGALWVILNFPHTVTVSSPGTVTSTLVSVTGAVNASLASANISDVQISLNGGDWSSCSATDGAFDSNVEDYVCSLDMSSSANGGYSVRVKAIDQLTVETNSTNYAETSFTLSVSSSSGGGGGFSDIAYSTPGLSRTFRYFNSPLTEIVMNPEEDGFAPDLFVEKLTTTTQLERVPSLLEVAYRYFDITPRSGGQLFNASIEFYVETDWAETHGVSLEDIVLKRYVDDAWIDLPTQFVRKGVGRWHYRAVTPGFSFFAIGVRTVETEVVAERVTEEAIEESPTPVAEESVPEATGQVVQELPAEELSELEERRRVNPLLWALFGVVALIALAGGYWLWDR